MSLFIRAQLLSRFVQHRLLIPTATPDRENLVALRELAEAGKVVPAIDRTYPLDETAEAIRHLEVEHARAKVVITV
jgi:NADPH:quinone reductase-like Zn-dependent oxidoreductase